MCFTESSELCGKLSLRQQSTALPGQMLSHLLCNWYNHLSTSIKPKNTVAVSDAFHTVSGVNFDHEVCKLISKSPHSPGTVPSQLGSVSQLTQPGQCSQPQFVICTTLQYQLQTKKFLLLHSQHLEWLTTVSQTVSFSFSVILKLTNFSLTDHLETHSSDWLNITNGCEWIGNVMSGLMCSYFTMTDYMCSIKPSYDYFAPNTDRHDYLLLEEALSFITNAWMSAVCPCRHTSLLILLICQHNMILCEN